MPYSTSLTAPNEVVVGESFDVALEVCCDDDSGCRDAEFFATLDGYGIVRAGAAFVGDFCVDYPPGSIALPSLPDWIEFGGEGVIVYEPGTYTLSWPDGSKQITVTEPPFDSDAVSVNCAGTLPNQLAIGETVQVEAEVVNDNEAEAYVVVGFTVGDASTSKIVNVGGNATTTVTDTFEAATAGDVDVSVNKSAVYEEPYGGTPHPPRPPAF